jgi:hypothetical protein
LASTTTRSRRFTARAPPSIGSCGRRPPSRKAFPVGRTLPLSPAQLCGCAVALSKSTEVRPEGVALAERHRTEHPPSQPAGVHWCVMVRDTQTLSGTSFGCSTGMSSLPWTRRLRRCRVARPRHRPGAAKPSDTRIKRTASLAGLGPSLLHSGAQRAVPGRRRRKAYEIFSADFLSHARLRVGRLSILVFYT